MLVKKVYVRKCYLNADTLDLCTFNGKVVGLSKLSQFEYIAPQLIDRETYVPVVVDIRRQKGVGTWSNTVASLGNFDN